MSARNTTEQELRELAQEVAAGLRQGRLSLKQVLGISHAELDAVFQVGERLRRQGRLQRARAVYSLILAHDPYHGQTWLALADLQRREGQHLLAATCYEVAGLLGERQAAASYHQGVCFAQLGEAATARECYRRALALIADAPRRPLWAEHASRALAEAGGAA